MRASGSAPARSAARSRTLQYNMAFPPSQGARPPPSSCRNSSGMASTHEYAATEPSRSAIDALAGRTLLEFGSPWCGHCRRAQPLIDEAFASHAGVRHIKVADASQRRLGRSFAVKLWPTLVFLKDGREVARLVRPRDAEAIRKALAEIDR